MPACIVRPSIMTSTWKEPIAGWADSVYAGLLAGSSLGLLRTMHCHTDKKLDFVPADYVTSCLIAADQRESNQIEIKTRFIGGNTKKEFKVDSDIVLNAERTPVYNYVSCQRPITWKTFQKARTHAPTVPRYRV